jgi:AraC family transcriptional activator of pobA
MSVSDSSELPTHSLREENDGIHVDRIGYKNPYDFTRHHRHSYFEVMFFEEGGGSQLIDFVEYPVREYSCYLIQPKQVHLLKRGEQSKGRLLQFNSESIESSRLHRLLQERIWQGKGAAVFEQKPELITVFEKYLDILEKNMGVNYRYNQETNIYLVQALLYNLLSVQLHETATTPPDKDFSVFLSLVDAHHRAEHSLGFYLEQLQISQKKLSTLAKKHHGATPLQVIHHRILLEAKRLLTFGEQSHKEIALDLGFDNPAAFSAFIKKRTGRTASELQFIIGSDFLLRPLTNQSSRWFTFSIRQTLIKSFAL